MLTTLRQIIEQVLKEPNIEKALDFLVHRTREALCVDCCSVYIAEQQRQRYRLVATDGLSRESVGKVVLRFGEGLVGLVGKRNELLNLADAQNHPNFKYIPEIGEEEFRSFLGVPVEHEGVVLGVLIIQQKDSRQFTETEESFLVTLAAQLASILYLSDLKEKSESETHEEPLACDFGSGGIAIARGWVWQPHMELEQVLLKKTDDPEMQVELFHQAVFQLQLDLDSLTLRIYDTVKKQDLSNVFDAYQQLLEDGEFTCAVDQKIYDESWCASSAVKLVTEDLIKNKEAAGQKEEALSINDLAQRILSRLAHSYLEDFDFSEPVILLAEEITAALIAEVPRERIAGIVSLRGGGNSLAAILARNMNIPTLMGVSLPLQKLDRHLFIVDGIRRELLIDPPAGVIAEYSGMMTANAQNSRVYMDERNLPAETEDQVHINVNLNAGLSVEDNVQELLPMIDGVGLYRTEVEFMMHKTFPTELEECRHYEEVLKNFADRKVIMRTMDVGGDKPLPYLPVNELNPFLGWRGIRISLDRPNLLLTQKASLKLGDEIAKINGIEMSSWYRIVDMIHDSNGAPLNLVVKRDGSLYQTTVVPENKYSEKTKMTVPYVGIAPEFKPIDGLRKTTRYGLVDALIKAVSDSASMAKLVLVSTYKLANGTISADNISGPIAIAQGAKESASFGFKIFISFLAAISVNLGILNLMPIPVLDGGQLLFLAYEAVMRKEPSARTQMILTSFGAAILLTMMIFAVFNDIKGF